MYIVLTEADSDFQAMKVLIRRLAGDEGVKIRGRGFAGSGDLLGKGSRILKSLAPDRATRCLVVHDCDDGDQRERIELVKRRIFEPAGVPGIHCAVVPKEEIEAWILADLNALSAVAKDWKPPRDYPNPEAEPSPKELLRKLTMDAKARPRYNEASNSIVVRNLKLDVVEARCPSFGPLVRLVREGKGNI